MNFSQTATGAAMACERVGYITLKVGSYWAFKDAKLAGEDDDLAMFRLIRERNHFKKWSYILALATACAVILAAAHP